MDDQCQALGEQLRFLLELQNHDRRIRVLELRQDELSASEQGELRAGLCAAQEAVERIASDIAAQKRQAKYWEQEAQALRGESSALDRRLYGGQVTNLKELDQAEKKSASLKEKASDLEDRVLMSFEETEELEKRLTERRENAAELDRRLNEADSEVRRELAEVREQLRTVTAEREKAATRIGGELLARYEHMRAKKGGIAVAEFKDGACTACRVSLPVILANRVRRYEEIIPCENCGRLLCWLG